MVAKDRRAQKSEFFSLVPHSGSVAAEVLRRYLRRKKGRTGDDCQVNSLELGLRSEQLEWLCPD